MLLKFTSSSTAMAGEYDWVKTNDSWRGELTPVQAGYSETIRLTENGVYQVFRNRKKVTERKFTITKSLNQTGQPDSVYRLRFVNEGSHSGTTDLVLQLDNGSLFTSIIPDCRKVSKPERATPSGIQTEANQYGSFSK